jgi:hypothetical protein
LNTNGEVTLAGSKNIRREVEKADAWRRRALGRLLANCRLFISANDRKVTTLMPWCESKIAARDILPANFRSWEISFFIPAVFCDYGKSFDNIQDFPQALRWHLGCTS